MYALVRFSDNSEGIYPMKNIKRNGNLCIVKHKGCKFEAEILATEDVKENLTKPILHELSPLAIENVSAANIEVAATSTSDTSETREGTTEETTEIMQVTPEYISVNQNQSLDFDNYTFGSDLINVNSSNSMLMNSFTDPCAEIQSEREIDSPARDLKKKSLDDLDYEPEEEDKTEQDNGMDVLRNLNIESIEEKENLSSSFNVSGFGCDDTNMYVEESRGKSGSRKMHFCYYCKTKQQKIARHLELVHKDVEEIQKFIHLPKGNAERKAIIAEIRKKGDFLFNMNEHFNKGEMIVSRRPQNKFNRTASDFKACANCKGFFSKSTLRFHFKECTGRSSGTKRLVMVLSKKVTSRLHPIACDVVKNQLFPPLREDSIVKLIRCDEMIILYANKMAKKYKNPRHFEMIRQRLRLVGRFLRTLKQINQDVNDLSSMFDPKFCDATLESINIESRFNPSTSSYSAPTVAFHLGTLLKQICNIFLTECLKKHEDEKKKNAKNFLKIFTQEINININRTVAESQIQIKRRKTTILPSTEDIRKLHKYLLQIRKQAFEDLQKKYTHKSWMDLAESTLISILVFNRRRPGEVERLLIDDFKNLQGINEEMDKDLFNSLSVESREIAKKYVRCLIRGKLNRTVPILLDNSLVESVKLLINLRVKTGVPKKNPYVFGMKGINKDDSKYLRACNLIRKYSENCGAEYPERLRGTKLRKHIATKCITLNLEQEEVSDLANFMGHAEKIHKAIYRQPILSREILRMSKLLEVIQGEGSDENESGDEEIQTDNNEPIEKRNTLPDEDEEASSVDNICKKYSARKRSTSPYGKVKRRKWSREEENTVLGIFRENIIKRKLPSFSQIQKAIRENESLQQRTSPQIKTWIHNQLKSKRKNNIS